MGNLKSVLRGDIISYESSLKKQREKRLLEIDNRLTQLENAYRDSTDSDLLNEITALKLEFNSILWNQVNNMLLQVKQRQYELGDKPDKLLSRQLRGLQASRAIHKIKNKKGVVLTNPTEINDTFKEFYEELYKSKGCLDPSALAKFLHSLHLPKLGCTEQAALNANITIAEILDVIKCFPGGKAPGPDGFWN